MFTNLPPAPAPGRRRVAKPTGTSRVSRALVALVSLVAAIPAAGVGAGAAYILPAFFTDGAPAGWAVNAVTMPIAAIVVGSGVFVWVRRSLGNRRK